MRPHEKLDVWKRYKATDSFPKEERFGLTSQVRRAAVSIPANIAEGAARQTDREFINFLAIAQGSASELETELLIAYRLGYVEEAAHSKMRAALDDISRMIVGLSRHLKQKSS